MPWSGLNRARANTAWLVRSISTITRVSATRCACDHDGKTAPGNPETYRREVAWMYGQSSPSVSKGDLYYNFIDHGLTEERRHKSTLRRFPSTHLPVSMIGAFLDRNPRARRAHQRIEVCRDERARPLPYDGELRSVPKLSATGFGRNRSQGMILRLTTKGRRSRR